MRSLDYHIQKTILIILMSLMTLSLFNEGFMVVWLGMFVFGIYHLIHFVFYFAHKMISKQRIGKYMITYIFMVIAYFAGWYQLHDQVPEPYSWHLFGIIALLIGAYYFYNVHKMNLNPKLRYY